jgi:hypothetical protein
MACKIRIEFEGASYQIYHVMCRGDRRDNIFADDAAQACQHGKIFPENARKKD